MPLNRALQLDILHTLAEHYPRGLAKGHFNKWPNSTDFMFQLKYLEEHGLASRAWTGHTSPTPDFAHITAKGLDFIADDGGLSAILGVVTIRLHDDTIKQLVAQKIQESDLPPADKKQYLDQLRELPAETTKHLVMKLVDMGLEAAPQAMGLLGKFLVGP